MGNRQYPYEQKDRDHLEVDSDVSEDPNRESLLDESMEAFLDQLGEEEASADRPF